MARYGVSITKSTSFRGGVQEFSNVYYYEALTLPDETQAATIINNLASLEKTFHGTSVTFVRGRLWSQGGSPGTNNMINQVNLTGTGARTPGTSMDKERAFLFRIRAGSDSRGNPVYLRKWFHAMGEFTSGATIASTQLQQTVPFTAGEKATQVAAMQAIGDANGSPGAPKLCAKSGRQPGAGENFQAHSYLEHHQLGDQWRAQ
jgi:hypothetical protein